MSWEAQRDQMLKSASDELRRAATLLQQQKAANQSADAVEAVRLEKLAGIYSNLLYVGAVNDLLAKEAALQSGFNG